MATLEKKIELVKCISEIQFQIEKIKIISQGENKNFPLIHDTNFKDVLNELNAKNYHLNQITINLEY